MKTQQGTRWRVYYILKDNLGSWTTITDSVGTVEQEMSFDAWGNRREPDSWRGSDQLPAPLFDRGFTGHEHLYAFGLINMNGRCYDPQMSSFLSVKVKRTLCCILFSVMSMFNVAIFDGVFERQ